MPINYSSFKKALGDPSGYGSVVAVTAPDGTEYVSMSHEHDRGNNMQTGEYGIEFEWNFSISPYPNHGVVYLDNVLRSTADKFERGEKLKLNAGWHEKTSSKISPAVLAVDGTISAVKHRKHLNDDHFTVEIYFIDSPETLLAKPTSRFWLPDTTYDTVLNDLQGDLGLPWEKNEPVVVEPYKYGFCAFGRIWDYMKIVARDTKSKLYCYNGWLRLMDPYDGIEEINPDSGAAGGATIKPPQLRRHVPAHVTQQIPTFPLYVTYEEKKMLSLQMAFEPTIGPDSVITLEGGGSSVENVPEGRKRVVMGKHFRKGTLFQTDTIVLPY